MSSTSTTSRKNAYGHRFPFHIVCLAAKTTRCRCHPISTYLIDMRWRLFGNILCLDEEALTNQAMSAYFQTDELLGYCGRPRTGLPRTRDTDLQQIGYVETIFDLQQLRRIAINKSKWRKLLRTIQKKRCKRS